MSQLCTYSLEKTLLMHLTVLVQPLQCHKGLWTGGSSAVSRVPRDVLLSSTTA